MPELLRRGVPKTKNLQERLPHLEKMRVPGKKTRKTLKLL